MYTYQPGLIPYIKRAGHEPVLLPAPVTIEERAAALTTLRVQYDLAITARRARKPKK